MRRLLARLLTGSLPVRAIAGDASFKLGEPISDSNPLPVTTDPLATFKVGEPISDENPLPIGEDAAALTIGEGIGFGRRAKIQIISSEEVHRFGEVITLDNALPVKMGSTVEAPSILVIEGDSITSTAPNTPDLGFYSYLYQQSRPDKTVHVTAQGSRFIQSVNDPTFPNTFVYQRPADLALSPDVLTILPGANDLSTSTYPTTQAWYDTFVAYLAPIRAAGVKILVGETLPFGTNHPSYQIHNARRLELLPLLRAGVGVHFDGIIPFSEHPVLGDVSLWLNNSLAPDGVHPLGHDPATAGSETQDHMFDVYKAVVDPVMNGRITNTQPVQFTLGPSLAGATIGGKTRRSLIITGLGIGVAQTCSISGPGRMRKGAGAFGVAPFTVFNGVTVEVELDHGPGELETTSLTLTVGNSSTTLSATTGVAAAQVETVYHGFEHRPVTWPSTSETYPVAFEPGVAIVFAYPGATGAFIDGEPMQEIASHDSGALKVYALEVTGPGNLTLTSAAAGSVEFFQFAALTAKGASVDTITTVKNTPGYLASPHPLPEQTVAQGGLQIGFFHTHTGTKPTVTPIAGTTLIDYDGEIVNTEWRGLAVVSRATTGQMALDIGFGRFPAVGLNISPA
jgi:hypothetical protein